MIPKQNLFANFNVINGTSYLALNYDLFEINDVGEFIWGSIDGKRDVNQISKVVADKYNVDIEVVDEDVRDFINLIVDKGLAQIL